MFPCGALSDDVLRLVSCCNQVGDTALLNACADGRLDVARWLVTDAGSDVRSERCNVRSSCRCSCGCLDVSFLYREPLLGAWGWCCDQDGSTALLVASAKGHLDVARWLVTDAGSDARSERSNVSCRCRCGFPCVSLLRRER